MLLLLFLIQSSSSQVTQTGECDIDVSKRIRIGNQQITPVECMSDEQEAFACYDSSYGCYRSKNDIVGFIYKHGDSGAFDLFDSESEENAAMDIQVCSKLCLRNSDCKGFTLASFKHLGRYCHLKNKRFKRTTGWVTTMVSYDRYAVKVSSCETGECTETTLQTYSKDAVTCKSYCESNPACNYYSLTPSGCQLKDKCTVYKNAANSFSCTKTVALVSKSIYFNENSLTNVSDSDESTCVWLKPSPFVLRYPFPQVDAQLNSLTLTIKGSQLSCMAEKLDLININSLFVYIPLERVYTTSFTGSFKICELLSSSSIECTYICDCQERYCEGIYVNAFSKDGGPRVCEIQI
ncbi:unnamed protein product [Dimorphilus gyrociliatus]|uniref:Uncharacterized protein n=1 Tax=Dimorphilus gyrociliatus TaxID=2664684 RepID=A0A7I8W878_9ANNE|nr:unnamed protein product [Dimorphilus gyrociliatus]